MNQYYREASAQVQSRLFRSVGSLILLKGDIYTHSHARVHSDRALGILSWTFSFHTSQHRQTFSHYLMPLGFLAGSPQPIVSSGQFSLTHLNDKYYDLIMEMLVANEKMKIAARHSDIAFIEDMG